MSAFQVPKIATAFSTSPIRGKKRPRVENGKHLAWLRTLPCVISGKRPVEAAHIRYADPVYGKREVGGGEKPDDKWVLPLSSDLHRQQHGMNERLFWSRYGIDPCAVALSLYAATGDDEMAEVILGEARKRAATFVNPAEVPK